MPTFPHVYYAPNYKWESGKLTLKEGKVAGTDEYIEGKANITPNGQAITVEFSKANATIRCALRQIIVRTFTIFKLVILVQAILLP